MNFREVFFTALVAATTTIPLSPMASADDFFVPQGTQTQVPTPNPNPYPPRPIPTDPSFDPLAYQRQQLRSEASRLFYSANTFYSQARQLASRQQVFGDRYAGQRVVLITDPSQRGALALTGRLLNAAGQFANFQNGFQNCGVYEQRNQICNRSLGREIALLRNLQSAYQIFRVHAYELVASRTVSGQQQLQQIARSLQLIVETFRVAGLIDRRPAPPAPMPLPPQPVPQPQPQPQPLPPAPQPLPQPQPPAPDQGGGGSPVPAPGGYGPGDRPPY